MKKHLHQSGFTLLEMVVVLSIMSIMAGVSIFNYQGFQNTIEEQNLAYDIALLFQRAKLVGGSATEATSGTRRRGIHLEYGDSYASEFVFFEDAGSAGFSGSDEVLDRVQITGSAFIDSVCVGENSGDCDDITESISVVFERPNPEAFIIVEGESGFENYIELRVRTENNEFERKVTIDQSGFIAVQ